MGEHMKMTAQDVAAAYRIFLGRNPENGAVTDSRVGLSRERLFVNFITAKEFIRRPENIKLILQTAQAIEVQSGRSTLELPK
jgi:hypothetical protein